MSIRSNILTIMLLAIFGGFAVVPVQAQDYDLVIRNGRVMDPETKYDEIANVGILFTGLMAAVLVFAVRESIEESHKHDRN